MNSVIEKIVIVLIKLIRLSFFRRKRTISTNNRVESANDSVAERLHDDNLILHYIETPYVVPYIETPQNTKEIKIKQLVTKLIELRKHLIGDRSTSQLKTMAFSILVFFMYFFLLCDNSQEFVDFIISLGSLTLVVFASSIFLYCVHKCSNTYIRLLNRSLCNYDSHDRSLTLRSFKLTLGYSYEFNTFEEYSPVGIFLLLELLDKDADADIDDERFYNRDLEISAILSGIENKMVSFALVFILIFALLAYVKL
jgi:hypothetical protein